MTFGEYVAKLRQAKSLTQKELASLVIKENGQPISYQYVAEIEAGRRNPPSDLFIEQLARIFEISPEILYIKARRFPPGFNTDDPEFAASVFRSFGASKAAA
jgi:transcriptional regulator with XRE-family HTH domain